MSQLNRALFEAIRNKDEKLALQLIDLGADINAINGYNDRNVLIEACGEGCIEIVKLILSKKKCDVNCKRGNSTPLISAAYNDDNIEIVKLLIEAGANLDLKSCNESALLIACTYSCNKIATLLIEKGANVNLKPIRGESCLYKAVSRNNVELIRHLIKYGANLEIKNNSPDGYNNTPLIIAAFYGYLKSVNILLEHGADVNAKDCDGTTSLMLAAAHGYPEVFITLMRNGASLQIKNKQGLTALDLIKRYYPSKNSGLLTFLKEHKYID